MSISFNADTGITNVNGTAAAPAITGTDTDTGLYFGTNTLGLSTAGTAALNIDTSQNVGIGTTSPTAKLDINGDSVVTGLSGYRSISLNGPITGGTTARYAGIQKNYDSPWECKLYAGYGSSGNGSPLIFYRDSVLESLRIDANGVQTLGPSSTATYPYNSVNAVNYKRQLTSGTAQSVFTFTKPSSSGSAARSSFMGILYIAFSGRTSGGTTCVYGFSAAVNIGTAAGATITSSFGSIASFNAVSSGLAVSCAVSLTSASATSANLSVTITQTSGTLQDNEITTTLIGANSSTDSTSYFTITPA